MQQQVCKDSVNSSPFAMYNFRKFSDDSIGHDHIIYTLYYRLLSLLMQKLIIRVSSFYFCHEPAEGNCRTHVRERRVQVACDHIRRRQPKHGHLLRHTVLKLFYILTTMCFGKYTLSIIKWPERPALGKFES